MTQQAARTMTALSTTQLSSQQERVDKKYVDYFNRQDKAVSSVFDKDDISKALCLGRT